MLVPFGEEGAMFGSVLLTTASRLGRATAAQAHRSRVSPCRLARKLSAALRGRRQARATAEIDWFDGIEPDELAG